MIAPPVTVERLLEALSTKTDFRDNILGDLAEEFALLLEREGAAAARRWYYRESIRTTPHLLRDWARGLRAPDVRHLADIVIISAPTARDAISAGPDDMPFVEEEAAGARWRAVTGRCPCGDCNMSAATHRNCAERSASTHGSREGVMVLGELAVIRHRGGERHDDAAAQYDPQSASGLRREHGIGAVRAGEIPHTNQQPHRAGADHGAEQRGEHLPSASSLHGDARSQKSQRHRYGASCEEQPPVEADQPAQWNESGEVIHPRQTGPESDCRPASGTRDGAHWWKR